MAKKNGKEKRPRTPKLLTEPGEIIKGPSVVVCTAPMKEGGMLAKPWIFNVTTRRKDTGDFQLTLQWWDGNHQGFWYDFPDGVCKTIFRHHREIIQDSKKIRGQRAFQTAKQNAEKAELGNEA